ncbi:MAG: hypothetical protein IKN90_06410, partial [Treponema sp.]|nr:hypothetical protein [Treponema sp.]
KKIKADLKSSDLKMKILSREFPWTPNLGGGKPARSPKPAVFPPPNLLRRYALATVSSLGTA